MINPFMILTSSFAIYRGLPRAIYALFLAQIVNAVGNLVYPFLTFFLTQRLEYDSATAGMFIFIASTAYVPGSLIGGKLADAAGRKKVLLIAQGLAGVMFIPCAFLSASPIVPWFIIAANFFGGAANPTHEAITTDITTEEQRKPAFSLLYLGHNIGFAVGPMIAGFLFTHSLPLLFLGDAATTFIALVFVAVLVPESKPSEEIMESHGGPDSNERAEIGGLLPVLFRRPYLLAFSFISLLLTFVYSQFTFSLPLQLEELHPSRGPIFYGTLMTVNALTVIFLTAPMIAVTRSIKPVLTVALSALLFAFGFGMIFFIKALPLFLVSTVIWTVGEILQATNTNVYIAGHTPISHRGRFNSILPIIIGAGFAVGPPVMGTYIETAGIAAVWPLMGGISLFAAAALSLLYMVETRRGIGKVRIES
jgi:MFS family permease